MAAAAALLSRLLGPLLVGVLSPASVAGGVGSLNLEELSEMRYGIEILPLPVLGGQVRRRGGGAVCRRRREPTGRREASAGVLLSVLGSPGPRGRRPGGGAASGCQRQVLAPDRDTPPPAPAEAWGCLSLHPPRGAGGLGAHSGSEDESRCSA